MKKKIGSGQQLLDEALSVQLTFLEVGQHWNLVKCIESIIEKDCFEVNEHAIESALIVARGLDEEKTKYIFG